jgi:hypothetical protein
MLTHTNLIESRYQVGRGGPLLAKISSHFHTTGVRYGHEADPGKQIPSACYLQRGH